MAKFKQFLMNDHFRMFFTFTVIPALVAYNFFTAYARYSLNYLALGQSSIVSWISIYTLLAFIQLISYFSLCFGRKRGHIWLIVSLVLYFIFKILNINDLVAAGNASYIMSSSIYKLIGTVLLIILTLLVYKQSKNTTLNQQTDKEISDSLKKIITDSSAHFIKGYYAQELQKQLPVLLELQTQDEREPIIISLRNNTCNMIADEIRTTIEKRFSIPFINNSKSIYSNKQLIFTHFEENDIGYLYGASYYLLTKQMPNEADCKELSDLQIMTLNETATSVISGNQDVTKQPINNATAVSNDSESHHSGLGTLDSVWIATGIALLVTITPYGLYLLLFLADTSRDVDMATIGYLLLVLIFAFITLYFSVSSKTKNSRIIGIILCILLFMYEIANIQSSQSARTVVSGLIFASCYFGYTLNKSKENLTIRNSSSFDEKV